MQAPAAAVAASEGNSYWTGTNIQGAVEGIMQHEEDGDLYEDAQEKADTAAEPESSPP